jgi:hypothetical protein
MEKSFRLFWIFQFRIPVGPAPLRCAVEDRPERHQVGRAAGVLAGVGCPGPTLAAPEMTNGAITPGEDIEGRDIRVVRAMVILLFQFQPSFGMRRCISLDEIHNRLRLIRDDVVHAVSDQPGFDVGGSVGAETFRNLWNQHCKR